MTISGSLRASTDETDTVHSLIFFSEETISAHLSMDITE